MREIRWTRVEGGYETQGAGIYDNGAGLGPAAKGGGRWAVEVGGKWVANVDFLSEAKALAAEKMEE